MQSKTTEVNKAKIAKFDADIAEQFKEERLARSGDKPDPAAWSDMIESDPDFAEEFAQTFGNPEVKEADETFDPRTHDNYVYMELLLDRPGTNPELAKVTKRLRDKVGKPIGTANKTNPILDTRLYEVEYNDGHKAAMSANTSRKFVFTSGLPWSLISFI